MILGIILLEKFNIFYDFIKFIWKISIISKLLIRLDNKIK